MATTQVNGVSLWSERQGPSGSPVILVHGSWGDHHNWDLVAPRLADTHVVVSYDRRGHSQSQRLPSQARWHDAVPDLAARTEEAAPPPRPAAANPPAPLSVSHSL